MKTFLRQPPVPGFLITLLILSCAALQVAAQDASLVAIIKSQYFEQSEVGIPVLINNPNDERFRFAAFVDADSPGSIMSASVMTPGGATHNLVADGESFHFEANFSDKEDLDEDFAEGSYALSIVTQNDGTQNLTLTLPADSYSNVPRVTNWDAAQNIDSTMPFTLTWDPFIGGSTDDFVMVEIESDGPMGGSRAYESPGPGKPMSLNGTSTSVSIPASTLMPGVKYRASLSFFHIVAAASVYSTELVAFEKRTLFSIKAAGGTDTSPPYLERPEPPSGTTNVKDISVVSFRFSEPMNTAVEPADAIAWTGVADPDNFSYTWSQDGTRLFCRYLPTLPLDVTIGWELNPPMPPMTSNASGGANGAAKQGPGGPTQFQDPAGNVLQGGQTSGAFLNQ